MNKETKQLLENQMVMMAGISTLPISKEGIELILEQATKTEELLNPKTESAELNKERDVLMKNKGEIQC